MKITDIELKENGNCETGGLVHSRETLGEFMADLNDNEKQTLGQVNLSLIICGILPIDESNYPEVRQIPYYHETFNDLNDVIERL